MIKIKSTKLEDAKDKETGELMGDVLYEQSRAHIIDVEKIMYLYIRMLRRISSRHDHTKMDEIHDFYDFANKGFPDNHPWFERHIREERHHLNIKEGVPDDINMFDILEKIGDSVAAAYARGGKITKESMRLDPKLLELAYENTVKLTIENVEIE